MRDSKRSQSTQGTRSVHQFRDGGRICPRCHKVRDYRAPTSSLKNHYSLEWETVPDTCDVYLTGEYGIQSPGSPLWLAGQEVCYNCAPAIPYQFQYSKYWHTWSRLLLINFHDDALPYGYVEVNLTPIPASILTWQESVAPIIIRTHGTAPERGEGASILPKEVWNEMTAHLGIQTVSLLESDLWAHIDPAKLISKMRGGGVPLIEIMKG